MSTKIGGMAFFEQLPEDDEIDPDQGHKCLQEDDGEFSDGASQVTTKTIDDSEDDEIYKILADQPRNEKPPEAITEGGQDSVQTVVTAVEYPVSNTISENALSC